VGNTFESFRFPTIFNKLKFELIILFQIFKKKSLQNKHKNKLQNKQKFPIIKKKPKKGETIKVKF
jgi:hypothetical protein